MEVKNYLQNNLQLFYKSIMILGQIEFMCILLEQIFKKNVLELNLLVFAFVVILSRVMNGGTLKIKQLNAEFQIVNVHVIDIYIIKAVGFYNASANTQQCCIIKMEHQGLVQIVIAWDLIQHLLVNVVGYLMFMILQLLHKNKEEIWEFLQTLIL